MKKQFLAVAAVCAVSCCLAACGSSVGYEDLNLKLQADYTAISLTIIDKYDETTSLTSKYFMEFSDEEVTVNYTIERFAEISLDNSSEYIKPVLNSGVAVIKDGVVVSGNIGVEGVLPDGLDFKEEFFENAEIAKSSFFADVKDASGFLGTEITCTDMKVSALFGDVFYGITITYKVAGGNTVEYRYEFGI